MWRILFFLLVVFALGLGFAWLAERPGEIVVTFAGYQYQATLMVAAVAVTAIVAAAMILWWLVKSIWNSPYTISRYFRVRRRDRGYQALSTGMIAAGAGDAGLAHKKKREAMKLISADQEPLLHLLDAQALLLEGDHEAAREKFAEMADDPETRLLGLRGLYLEATRLGDRTAARHYASEAAEEAPQLGWAADATLEEKVERGEWGEALRLVEARRSTRQLDGEAADRRKAVLLTAKAITLMDPDPTGARNAALEAHRLAPGLVPATTAAARALIRLDDLRKAAKVLEAGWKQEPHPEIGDLYVHARPGDSAHDRLTRARRLRTQRRNNVESELVVARAALDAGEFAEARAAAEAALRISPREGACLLMADIEEAETADQGKVREWLARAVRAPRDPAWVADGFVAPKWAPISPVTGRFDAFEWRVPVERVAQTIEQSPPTAQPSGPVPAIGRAPAPPRDDDAVPAAAGAATVAAAAEPPEKVEAIVAEPAQASPTTDGEAGPAVTAEPSSLPRADNDEAARSPDEAARPAPIIDASLEDDEDAAAANAQAQRLPDDPGVDPAETTLTEPSRFRLF